MLIASGGTEVVGMKPPTDRKLQPGDSVITELTPCVNGYYAQICRTIVLGPPSAGQLESFSIFHEAQQAAQDLIKPGIRASERPAPRTMFFANMAMGITPAQSTLASAATASACSRMRLRTFLRTSTTCSKRTWW